MYWNKLTGLINCRACVVVSGWPCLYCYLKMAECEALGLIPCTLQYLSSQNQKVIFGSFSSLGNEMGLQVANIVFPVFLLLFLKWIMYQLMEMCRLKPVINFCSYFCVLIKLLWLTRRNKNLGFFLFSRFLWTTFSWLLVWRTLLKMLVFSSLRPSAEFISASASG